MSEETNRPEKESTTQPEGSADALEVEKLRSEVQSLREQLQRIEAQSEDRLHQWQRAQADLINFRRRVEQERSEHVKYANERLIARLLPILDDFERAFAMLPRELLSFTWIDGVNLIAAKLMAILQQEGLRPIEAIGKGFDPRVHEAIVVEDGVEPYAGQVTGELQRGYWLHERVLRPTLVKVGAAKSESPLEGGQGHAAEQQSASEDQSGQA